MKKIRVGMIGGGWRSQFFMRAAKGVPDVFEVSAVWVRDPEKAAIYQEKVGVPTVCTFEELVDTKPDYVIVCLPRKIAVDYIEKLYQVNIPVLCETPPGETVEDYERLWQITQQYQGKIQVAEQYFAWPLFSAWLTAVREGMIGEVSNISLSSLHGYHGANIIRQFLGVQGENCKIYGKLYQIPVTETGARDERVYEGNIINARRQRLTFEFEAGKLAFFDFSNVQYHSEIRTRQLNVQGTRGEIDDLTIRYLNERSEVVTQSLLRDDRGVYNISEWSNFGLMLGDRYLYRSPFPTARLNDDELAVATLMYQMKAYLEDGVEFYPLADALQDSYLSLMMMQALETPNEPVETKTNIWYQK